jgi:molecular chaperone HtpG
MYKSLNTDTLISLDDYVREMKEGQKYIYFAAADSKDALLAMPQMDAIKNKEYDVLLLTDDVDEFVLKVLQKYNDFEFKSINQGDLDLLSDEEKENAKKLTEKKQPLLDKITKSLNGKVKQVVISNRLTDSPICLVSGDGISFEMEKTLSSLPNSSDIKAERILELNANHPIFNVLENIQDDEDKLTDYTNVLLNQALLLEGFKVENPNEFIEKMCKIMIEATK